MSVPLYMDVHVPQAATDQLHRLGVDVAGLRNADGDSAAAADLLEAPRVVLLGLRHLHATRRRSR